MLPADADPMDVRYNMINWVHRSTRGWSYGGGVTDPRTGEIIKGNVTLGSLRVRQDFMIGAGLIPPYAEGDDPRACLADMSPEPDYLRRARRLHRLTRDVARAHPSALGARDRPHARASRTTSRRARTAAASVMDYPAPWVEIKDGKLDLSNAYAIGIGAFDKFAVAYAYSQFAPRRERDAGARTDPRGRRGARHALHHRLGCASGRRGASAREPVGQRRRSDRHAQARDGGAPHRALAVRPEEHSGRHAALRARAKLLPLYLHHRYQLQAAVKSLGGVNFTYAVRTPAGRTRPVVAEIVPPAKQKAALEAVLDTLSVDALRIPDRVLSLIPPTAFGYGGGTAEPFDRRTDPTFDPIGAATIAADVAVSALLQPQRAARVNEHAARNAANPSLQRRGDVARDRTWGAPRADGRLRPGDSGGGREPDGHTADGALRRPQRLGRGAGVGHRGTALGDEDCEADRQRPHAADA